MSAIEIRRTSDKEIVFTWAYGTRTGRINRHGVLLDGQKDSPTPRFRAELAKALKDHLDNCQNRDIVEV